MAELQRVIVDGSITESRQIVHHPVLSDIYYQSPYSEEDIFEQLKEIEAELQQTRPEELKTLLSSIAAATNEFEVSYLPTYRRIEVPLKPTGKPVRGWRTVSPSRMRARRQPRGDVTGIGIQFALTDVSFRLNQLFDDIQRQSNFGYRSISANIIDELLGGLQLGDRQSQAQLPDIDALAIFLARIQSTESPDERSESIRDLYESGRIDNRSNRMLRYFLEKLSTVVDQTKELEAVIESFVDQSK